MAVSIVSAIWATAWRDGFSRARCAWKKPFLTSKVPSFRKTIHCHVTTCASSLVVVAYIIIHNGNALTPVDERQGLQGMQT